MAIKDAFKVTRKTFLNPSGWLDAENLKFCNQSLLNYLRSVFTINKPTQKETFDQAMQRLGLTEQDIVEATKRYRYFALLFVGIALLAFIYSFYLLFSQHAYIDWLLGMAVTGLFLGQAFRYDFWALQLKCRRLGMTFAEWKATILNDKGSAS